MSTTFDIFSINRDELDNYLLVLSDKYSWKQFEVCEHDFRPIPEAAIKSTNSVQFNDKDLNILECKSLLDTQISPSTSSGVCMKDSVERSASYSPESESPIACASRSRSIRRILTNRNCEEDVTLSLSPIVDLAIEAEIVTTIKRGGRGRVIVSDSDSDEPATPQSYKSTQNASSVIYGIDQRESHEEEDVDLLDSSGEETESVEEAAAAASRDRCREGGGGDSSNGGDLDDSEDAASETAAAADEYEYDDWLVDDAEEEDEGSFEGSDDEDDHDDVLGYGSDEEGSGVEDKENTRGRGNKPSTKYPPRSMATPRKTAGAPTPHRTPSRKEVNLQRVLALSTGKKRTQSYHHSLAQDLFQIYNEVIFEGQLPADLQVTWNKRLLTTAGFCRCSRRRDLGGSEEQRVASIELSTKVVDSEERMRETLVHEMCHAATFLIDGADNAGHGRLFKAWGRRATRHFPDIGVVGTCHSYDIHAAHKFQCVRDNCAVVYSRHSKKGLDINKQRCGVCCSQLKYIGMTKKDGTAVKPRQATGFSVFVKHHFARVKAAMAACGEAQGTKEVMRELAAQYKAHKVAAAVEKPAPSVDSGDEIAQLRVTLSPLADSSGVKGAGVDSIMHAFVDLTV